MRNNLGLYHIFGKNEKAKILFYNWCKGNEELCEYDIEQIENDLFIPCIDNLDRYFHFHTGNILDFLESRGYYIGLPLRGKFKYVTCVYHKENERVGMPFYNNSGVVGRTRALEIGVQKAIEHLENNLK
jgi:hypothetical protein